MTTPEPRVRVVISQSAYWYPLAWVCDACDTVSADGWLGNEVSKAADAAHRHAQTCPALRLAYKECKWAEFLRELAALRDRWRAESDKAAADGFPLEAEHYYRNADDLADLIDRATDGGTG